jgi:hypothetical protein
MPEPSFLDPRSIGRFDYRGYLTIACGKKTVKNMNVTRISERILLRQNR